VRGSSQSSAMTWGAARFRQQVGHGDFNACTVVPTTCYGQIYLTILHSLSPTFANSSMPTIPISDAKARLTALVREVAASGETVVITVNGTAMVELRPFAPAPTPGRFKGQISIADDAFAPLDAETADTWGL
jgi:antitoxin (DNA-binding transcriptional repressor) of toxin-antitoxin stability system